MKQWNFIRGSAGLMLCMILMAGCAKQMTSSNESSGAVVPEPVYISDTSPSDCQLCGEGKGTLLPAYWEEDNIGIIDLNPF